MLELLHELVELIDVFLDDFRHGMGRACDGGHFQTETAELAAHLVENVVFSFRGPVLTRSRVSGIFGRVDVSGRSVFIPGFRPRITVWNGNSCL